VSGGGDAYRFPPLDPGDEPDEVPPTGVPVGALITVGAAVVCLVALVFVEVDDATIAKLVATASMALSVLAAGVTLLQADRRGGRLLLLTLGGAGLAVVATILSATIDFHSTPAATRAADGSIATAGSVAFTSLRIGDCFRSAPASDATSVDGVPCTDSHRGEIAAEVDLTDQVKAKIDASFAVARQRCQDALRSAVRVSDPAVSSATLVVIPAPRSTGLAGLCAVVTRADRTGSVRS
jgi:hypothetical protein